jgi:small conductance mechanosensitive channel
MNDPVSAPATFHADVTAAARFYSHFFVHESSVGIRILLIAAMAVVAHATVKAIRHLSEWLLILLHGRNGRFGVAAQKPSSITVIRLIVSGIVFVVYFSAVGLIFQEIGFNLATYLATASVFGLAISFGSQGLVQDIVIGLTLILWDAMAVNDLVEITGPTNSVIGRVEEIGMRFTKVVNFYNQKVFIPNRTIGNVSRFQQGGVDAYADPQIPAGVDQKAVVQIVQSIAIGMWAQFGAIILTEPAVWKGETVPGGSWEFLRVHFKIWPGQGNLIEITFRQEVIKAMRPFDPKYADWQVPVTYRAGTTSRNPKAPHSP